MQGNNAIDWGRLIRSGRLDDYALAMLLRSTAAFKGADEIAALMPALIECAPTSSGRLAIDAAIDLALAAMAREGRSGEEGAALLGGLFPELRGAIEEAVALTAVVTLGLEEVSGDQRGLPADFGPTLEAGVARYELRRHLGRGAFADVFLAVDRRLSESDAAALVAIKVLRRGDALGRLRARLFEEATKTRRLDHPNILRVLDFGVHEPDEAYIVLEHVAGGDLGTWIAARSGPLGIREAVGLAAEIARGVEAAHRAGIVHCDLKPANVLMTPEGRPKVADFGVAVRLSGAGWRRDAQEQNRIGNLAFMSPEQFRGEAGAISPVSDVYALGGLLSWLLTGAPPNGVTRGEIERSHSAAAEGEPPAAPSERRRGIDRDLDAVCRRAMAARPRDRYSSAGLFADDLDRWLGREPLSWTRPSLWRSGTLFVRRRPFVAATICLMILLMTSVTVGLVVARRLIDTAHAQELRAARAEIGREWRQKNAQDLQRLLQGLAAARERQGADDALMILSVLDSVHGAHVLDAPEALEMINDTRLNLIKDTLDGLREAHGETAVPTLIWETAYGFWLLRHEAWAEAEVVTARNASAWRAIVSEDDPWLEMAQGLCDAARACSIAHGFAEASAGEIRALLARLDAAAESLRGSPACGRQAARLAEQAAEILRRQTRTSAALHTHAR